MKSPESQTPWAPLGLLQIPRHSRHDVDIRDAVTGRGFGGGQQAIETRGAACLKPQQSGQASPLELQVTAAVRG